MYPVVSCEGSNHFTSLLKGEFITGKVPYTPEILQTHFL